MITIRKFADFALLETGKVLKAGSSQIEGTTLVAADISDLVDAVNELIADGSIQIVLTAPGGTQYTLAVSDLGVISAVVLPPP